MTKEIVICIIIVVFIFMGDLVTQNYTNDSISEASSNLNQLRDELVKEDVDLEMLREKIIRARTNWDNRHKKLAYYIEHDELEKVETDLSALYGYIDVEEYEEAVAELDRTVYVLEHIKHKNVFNLENIF
ncbi:MAG: DUF4363 family protein [Clostridia bacterium]|nr:DUF4363 family protein [Clostridia bacterium]